MSGRLVSRTPFRVGGRRRYGDFSAGDGVLRLRVRLLSGKPEGHLNPRCDEPRCSRIQAYFTATPARNTPWLFLGFRAPSRPAAAHAAAAGSRLAARRARRSRRSRERVVLTDHEPNRILFELFRKHPPLPRHFDLGMTHPSDLLGGPLSGPRRYPRMLVIANKCADLMLRTGSKPT